MKKSYHSIAWSKINRRLGANILLGGERDRASYLGEVVELSAGGEDKERPTPSPHQKTAWARMNRRLGWNILPRGERDRATYLGRLTDLSYPTSE